MVVVAGCCLIALRVKPSQEVPHMQIKHGENQDLNSETDLRKEEKENSCGRRWTPTVCAHICLCETGKITAEASRSFQSEFVCHTRVLIT